MSLKDILGFELFNGKHILKDLGKHPWRSVTGIDPLSTGAWNKVLGRNDEPLVDQMGGAYGGHAISAFGNKDGGVYKAAQDAGIDTTSGGRAQDAAHVIAALIAGNYFAGKMPQSNQPGGMGSQQQRQQQEEYPARTLLPPQVSQNTAKLTAPTAAPYVMPQKQMAPPNGLVGLGFRKYYG